MLKEEEYGEGKRKFSFSMFDFEWKDHTQIFIIWKGDIEVEVLKKDSAFLV